MSLTKVSYSMINGAPANVLDFGADATGVIDSTTAIQAAIDSGASTVYLPEGTFLISNTIQVGTSVVYGSGVGTIIHSTSSTDTFRIGNATMTGGLSTGGQVSELQIELYNSSGIAVRFMETQNAVLRNVLVSSFAARPNTQIGIIIDGGNISSFFNNVQNVNCVGIDIGYQFKSSGTGYATSSTFINCSAVTYTNNTNGYGYQFIGKNGQDSIFVGGNLESCKKGIQMATGTWATATTQGTTWLGQRFESNSLCDIDWGNGGFRNEFYGYGNYGNNATPGFSPSLNFDATKENTISGEARGTWTPTFVSSGATFTYSTQVGTYIFDGNRVTAQCAISASASGTVTNQITISGLPFASMNQTGFYQSGSVGYAQRSTNMVGAYISPNSTTITLVDGANALCTPTTLGINGLDGLITVGITYII